jgi:hypothetical protein
MGKRSGDMTSPHFPHNLQVMIVLPVTPIVSRILGNRAPAFSSVEHDKR